MVRAGFDRHRRRQCKTCEARGLADDDRPGHGEGRAVLQPPDNLWIDILARTLPVIHSHTCDDRRETR